MKHKVFLTGIALAMSLSSLSLHAMNDSHSIKQDVIHLKQQSRALQQEINQLQTQLDKVERHKNSRVKAKPTRKHHRPDINAKKQAMVHSSAVTVHSFDAHPESLEFYPTALIADQHVVTYIAGTPIVSSPFLGARPAFDGSDYLVNISSINRDIRLMQQRRRMYRAYQKMGYPIPDMPIIALSGKVIPTGTVGRTYFKNTTSDWNLGTSELDVAAALNDMVEGYMALSYDSSPPLSSRQRVSNSSVYLNMGFVNIGNLDKTPFYFTAGQLFVPFGRFSSSMISGTLPMQLARTKSRPFILGYKSQEQTGPFAAIYGFKSDTTLGGSGVGGLNLGYIFGNNEVSGEVGASVISALNDSSGMQFTGSTPGTTFGGFASIPNGSEAVKKIPGVGVHGNVRFDRYSFTAEWVGALSRFRTQDLSFNGQGAIPSAGQLEAGMTFMAFNRPSTLAAGYQWSKGSLALNLPAQRISGALSTSWWKDTVERIEYRHDIDYKRNLFANGAAPVGLSNQNTIATGRSSDTLLAQIGVYF